MMWILFSRFFFIFSCHWFKTQNNDILFSSFSIIIYRNRVVEFHRVIFFSSDFLLEIVWNLCWFYSIYGRNYYVKFILSGFMTNAVIINIYVLIYAYSNNNNTQSTDSGKNNMQNENSIYCQLAEWRMENGMGDSLL